MEIKFNNSVENKKRNFSQFLKSPTFIYILILISIIILSVWIRTVNIQDLKTPDGNWSLGPDLDPFFFLRVAKEIVQYGHPLDPDMMRAAPLGAKAFWDLNVYGLVWAYQFLQLFSKNISFDFVAIIFPVFCFAMAVIFFFLLVRKLFLENLGKNKAAIVALISALLLAVIPAMLHRTVAGVPEHESPGIALFFLALYFFICAWKSEKFRNAFIFALAAGITSAAMTVTWGGFRFIFMTVALSMLIAFFFNQTKKKEKMLFFVWLISSFLMIILLGRMSITDFVLSISDTGFACFIAFILVIDLFLKKIKITEKFKKIPPALTSIIVSILIMLIPLIIFKFSYIPTLISKIIEGLVLPLGTGRISLTVAENKAPYLTDVISNFGLLLWTFFFGLILVFYESFKNLRKEKIILNSVFIIMLLGLIFTRFSESSFLNGENGISVILYLGAIVLFLFVLILKYVQAYQKQQENSLLEEFEKIDFSLIFVIAFSFWMIVSIRSGIRLFFIIGPAFIIASAFLVVKTLEYSLKNKDELQKLLWWIAFGIICLMLCLTFITYAKSTYNETKGTVPGMYERQWYEAMKWVQNNTEEKAIFAHWWDYGYWVQTLGNRPTIADGGHSVSYWNYLIGRHVLTGQNEQEALEFLYAHNTSYLLIDSSDIGKYPAYATIGSDENYDRLGSIGTFWIDEKQTQETKNKTNYIYVGGWSLDEDVVWNNTLYPAGKAGVVAVILPVTTTGQDLAFEQPQAVFIYQNKQEKIPIKYIYISGEKYEFNGGINNGLFIIPRVSETGLNRIGGALYLGKREVNSLIAKLYLMNESVNFKMVHSEESPLISSLNSMYNLNIEDFVMYNTKVFGPIKIWKIDYPENFSISEQLREDYLQKESPLPFALW